MKRRLLFLSLFVIQWFYPQCLVAGNYTGMLATGLCNSLSCNSVLASGKWMKAQLNEAGIHKITFNDLKMMGFQSPQNVKVFGFPAGMLPQMNQATSPDDLIQYAAWQFKDNKANDCWWIYIPEQTIWEADMSSGLYTPVVNQFSLGHSCIYLTEDTGISNLVKELEPRQEKASILVNEFDDFALLNFGGITLNNSNILKFNNKLLKINSVCRNMNIKFLENEIFIKNGNNIGETYAKTIINFDTDKFIKTNEFFTFKINGTI